MILGEEMNSKIGMVIRELREDVRVFVVNHDAWFEMWNVVKVVEESTNNVCVLKDELWY